MRASLLLALIAAAACSASGGPRSADQHATSSASDAGAATSADAAARPIDAISETEARSILAELFRGAGFRILYDVPIGVGDAKVALDGFDPVEQIGYEYIAAAELATAEAARRLASKAILVVGPATREDVREAGVQFVAALATTQPK